MVMIAPATPNKSHHIPVTSSMSLEVVMRIDDYTKFVLTVIAVCLVWLSLGGPSRFTVAQAQMAGTTGERVLISGWVDGSGKVHTLRDAEGANVPGVPVAVVWATR
jgi:hypothetical protein